MHESEYHNLSRTESEHWWHAGMAALTKDWLERLPGRAPRERLLDAGCGTGGGLRWLSAFGQVWGVDWHPLAVELAANRAGTGVLRADVQALPFAGESFGILTSFDVLYHQQVDNDWAALREFSRVLRPGGWLLLRLPAHNWLRGSHDRCVQTRHRYTRREVLEKLHAAGLRPVRVTYVNALLMVPAAIWRMGQRGLGQQSETDVRPVPRWLNRLLQGWLAVERTWLQRFDLPMGLSVLALAQKSP